MTADRLPFWAKCPSCGRCWKAAHFPADLIEFARLCAGARCPAGCTERAVVARQENGELLETMR